MTSWRNETCPKCRAANWWSQDDYDGDSSKLDPDPAIECRKCHHHWWKEGYYVSQEDRDEDLGRDAKPENHSELGEPTPGAAGKETT